MIRTPLLLACAFFLASPVQAQFSSDLPGVPRGRVSFLSGGQGRFELDLTAFKLGESGADTLAGGLRIGFGKSWRIGTNVELGWDFSLAEVRMVRPKDEGVATDNLDATAAYGARIGLKYQFFNVLDPDGYGISASLGAAYQPELKPGFIYSKSGDDSQTGGYAGSTPEDGGIDSKIHQSTIFMGAISYRTERVEADGAIVVESSSQDTGISPIRVYDGTSVTVGGRYRVTPGLGLGIVYWGSGAPPWRDRINFGLRDIDPSDFGFLVTFGSGLERGTDIMISSPTGSFSESLSFYLRVH